jgi:hypothetical protein
VKWKKTVRQTVPVHAMLQHKETKLKKEKYKPINVYVCGTDFLYEMGAASGGIRVFANPEEVHQFGPCGIAEIEIRFKKWVEKPV